MYDNIYPLAYKLTPGQTRTIYYLGFPVAWKTALLEIAQKNNPRFKDEYGLPTNALKKLVDSWMEGIIALSPLKKGGSDEHWLVSCYEYSKRDVEVLYEIIKVWVKVTYVIPPKISPLVKKLANNFCETIRSTDLQNNQSKAEICLTFEDGTVTGEAYQAIPLLAINHLLGKDIILNGQPLHLCYSNKNQLISQPITAGKYRHQYSFLFDFSVQTTPPQRQALLLCHLSIRRWIPDSICKDKRPFSSENINAHIRISENKYCQVPISYDYNKRQLDWRQQDKDCYNIWGYEQLPEANEVLLNPSEYAPDVLLPYKNGMGRFIPSKIGVGVSVVDKAALYQAVESLLGDMVCDQPIAQRVKLRGQKFITFKSPQAYSSPEAFRYWVNKCAETDHIAFELYGLWNDPIQQPILQKLHEKLILDFGENTTNSCMKIEFVRKEVKSLADAMIDNTVQTKIQRSEEIIQELGSTNSVTACIFMLPGPERYAVGDPKQVLRNAFARTGRVVQFINPGIPDSGDQSIQNKVDHAIYDLYRQLGVVTLVDAEAKLPPLANTPCIGMHVCTQIHGIGNKARFLPLYVTVNIPNGKTRVQCDAFSNREVSYREACLEMAQLFWTGDLEQRCVNASRSPAKQKLIELKNRYYQPDDCVLLVVQSDGNTRALWSGISDKEIGSYALSSEYCPSQINVGTLNNPIPFSVQNVGIRVIRIRSNQEIPDYFTDLNPTASDDHIKYSSASGLFQYANVFWGIHPKPNDLDYSLSLSESKVTHPTHRFAEKDMIEIYPLQLQPGDNAAEWAFYTNALRHIPIQYDQSTVLPLPLHLAKALEEYLFDA